MSILDSSGFFNTSASTGIVAASPRFSPRRPGRVLSKHSAPASVDSRSLESAAVLAAKITSAAASALGNFGGKVSGGETEVKESARERRFRLQAAARRLLPRESIKDCLRRPYEEFVQVRYCGESGRAFYRGLQTCGSV